ncbi:MAG: hypothetical protein EZS28_050325, partial [Streblomastix strix]
MIDNFIQTIAQPQGDNLRRSWSDFFLSKSRNKFLCQITYRFLSDNINVIDLMESVNGFADGLDEIMDEYTQKPHFSKDAIQAYVLLHAKFLLSFDGLLLMKYKFRQKVFGLCTQPQ